MSELMPRTSIREHAEAAAKAGKGPEACPYAAGTEPEHYWKDCFYTAAHRELEKAREVA